MANNEFCNADKHENPLRGSAVKKNKKNIHHGDELWVTSWG